MELLNLWHCVDSIVSMVFGTTASNTGHVTAACVCLQHSLGQLLLCPAFRHYVGEVMLTQIFTDLKIEALKSLRNVRVQQVQETLWECTPYQRRKSYTVRFQFIFWWNKGSGAGLVKWSTSVGNSLCTASARWLQRILWAVFVVFKWPQLHRLQFQASWYTA